jgi:hypothetical protein
LSQHVNDTRCQNCRYSNQSEDGRGIVAHNKTFFIKKRYAILRTSVGPGAEFTKSRKQETYWVAGMTRRSLEPWRKISCSCATDG